MLKLELSAEVQQATSYLSKMAQQHVPKAAAKALTRTAFDARDAVRASLPDRFTLRRPWVSRGIGMTPATTSTLTATVWSRDWFMALQESGGTKSGKISIPLGPTAQIAQTKVIPKTQRPARLLRQSAVFYRDGTVFKRQGAERIVGLYLLRREHKVQARFGMTDTVRSVALSEYQRQMQRALHEELARA